MKQKSLYAAIAINRKDANDLAQKKGKQRLLMQLRKAEAELIHRVNEAVKGPGTGSFTAEHSRVLLQQVRDTIRSLNKGILDVTLDQSGDATDKATRSLYNYLNKANKAFKGVSEAPLNLDEAAMFDRAHEGNKSSILNRLASKQGKPGTGILQRYGQQVIQYFENEFATAILTRRSLEDTKASLIASSPFLQQAPAFWAERIVRTETMGAFNRANDLAAKAANETLGDVVKILAATFDDRTGWDSYQVHGQIRRINEPFQWQGGLYDHPPNRPNDREVVIIHRIEWPIPSYLKWKSDSEVNSRYYQQRRSGSPGPRPNMTTIPLEQFGKSQPGLSDTSIELDARRAILG